MKIYNKYNTENKGCNRTITLETVSKVNSNIMKPINNTEIICFHASLSLIPL